MVTEETPLLCQVGTWNLCHLSLGVSQVERGQGGVYSVRALLGRIREELQESGRFQSHESSVSGAPWSQGRCGLTGHRAGLPSVAAPAAQGLAGCQPVLAAGWELGWGWGTTGSQSPFLGG